MSDQELLEMAAKAADYDVMHTMTGRIVVEFKVWDPLNDDGDALRLAVHLELFNGAKLFHYRSLERFQNPSATEIERTRRAIVLTAAEIGRAQL